MLEKKTIIITGITGGIGSCLAKELDKGNFHIIAPYRSEIKKGKISHLANITFIKNDLSTIAKIYEFINDVKSINNNGSFYAIINNAGMIAPKFTLNKDKFEEALFINTIVPIILTQNLISFIQKDGIVINTLSCTANTKFTKRTIPNFNFGDYSPNSLNCETNNYNLNAPPFISLKNYALTKRILSLYVNQLSQNQYVLSNNITVKGIDPGIVDTGIITQHKWFDPLADILFRPFIKKPQKAIIPFINALYKNK